MVCMTNSLWLLIEMQFVAGFQIGCIVFTSTAHRLHMMKSNNRTINLLSSLQVFWQNVKYVTQNYLWTYAAFLSPYMIYLCSDFNDREIIGKIIVFTCLVVWFAFGLYVSSQPKFVAVIAVLFLCSQHAYFTDHFQLDLILTLSCVLLMCIKQYSKRYYFAILQQLNDNPNNKDNARTS
jgi:hypothetical protein